MQSYQNQPPGGSTQIDHQRLLIGQVSIIGHPGGLLCMCQVDEINHQGGCTQINHQGLLLSQVSINGHQGVHASCQNLPPGVFPQVDHQGLLKSKYAKISHQRCSWAKLTKVSTRAHPITLCSNQSPGALPQHIAQIGHKGNQEVLLCKFSQNQLAGDASAQSLKLATKGCSCATLSLITI